jgi:hypothetical protein
MPVAHKLLAELDSVALGQFAAHGFVIGDQLRERLAGVLDHFVHRVFNRLALLGVFALLLAIVLDPAVGGVFSHAVAAPVDGVPGGEPADAGFGRALGGGDGFLLLLDAVGLVDDPAESLGDELAVLGQMPRVGMASIRRA